MVEHSGFNYIDNAYCRIQQRELDEISSRVIILIIGTNSKIFLLEILPWKEKDLFHVVRETNRHLSRVADKRYLFFSNPRLVLQEGNSGVLRKACTMEGINRLLLHPFR